MMTDIIQTSYVDPYEIYTNIESLSFKSETKNRNSLDKADNKLPLCSNIRANPEGY